MQRNKCILIIKVRGIYHCGNIHGPYTDPAPSIIFHSLILATYTYRSVASYLILARTLQKIIVKTTPFGYLSCSKQPCMHVSINRNAIEVK